MSAPAADAAAKPAAWKVALLIVLAILLAPVTIAFLTRSVAGERG